MQKTKSLYEAMRLLLGICAIFGLAALAAFIITSIMTAFRLPPYFAMPVWSLSYSYLAWMLGVIHFNLGLEPQLPRWVNDDAPFGAGRYFSSPFPRPQNISVARRFLAGGIGLGLFVVLFLWYLNLD